MIDANRVNELVESCEAEEGGAAFEFAGLPDDHEASAREGPHVPLYVYRMDRAKLAPHKAEIIGMLAQLPTEFMDNGGGGWSFLNLCNTASGSQWADFHRTMERLVMLGAAFGLADWMLPRDLWDVLPGGVPYVVVRRSKFAAESASC